MILSGTLFDQLYPHYGFYLVIVTCKNWEAHTHFPLEKDRITFYMGLGQTLKEIYEETFKSVSNDQLKI